MSYCPKGVISVDVPVVISIYLNDPPELKNPDVQYAPQYKLPVSGLKSISWPYPVTFANPKSVPIAVVAAVINSMSLISGVDDIPLTTSTIYAFHHN